MKSTLKRELKVRETVKRETIEVSSGLREDSGAAWGEGERKPPCSKERAVYACVARVSIGFWAAGEGWWEGSSACGVLQPVACAAPGTDSEPNLP